MATTEELRRDIEQARAGVGEALEAIGDRVAPKKVVSRAKENVAEKVEEVRDKVSPGRIVRRRTVSLRDTLGRVVGRDDTEDQDVHALGMGRGYTSDVRASEPSGSARARGQALSGRAGSAAGTVVEGARSAPQAVRERAEGNPVAAGLLVLAAGFLAGSLLPPTERERQLTSRAKAELDPMKDQLTETGRGIVGDLQQAAQQSLEQVRQTATQAAQQVKQEAEARAEAVKAQAQDATAQVKTETATATQQVQSTAKKSTGAVKAQAKQAKKETATTARAAKATTVKKTTAATRASTPAKRTTARARS